MKHKTVKIRMNVVITLAIILAMGGFLLVRALRADPAAETDAIGYASDTVRAEVMEIVEQGTVQLGSLEQEYQVAQVRILEGRYRDIQLQVDHGRYQILPEGFRLKAGDRILITVGELPDGTFQAYFIDYVRTTPLLVLFGIFVAVSILVSGWKGVQSLVSMGVSVIVIFYFIIPRILAGADPILISIAGSFIFLAVTQYLVYGWTLKTQIALAAIIIAMALTGVLSVVFVNYAALNGFGDENAMFLVQQNGNLNVQNLLIASVIIGALGVLDDLVVGQASAVIELHLANPAMSFQQRFRAAFRIGRDHIAATVNTLVLAYLGASLMMFLLFSLNNPDYLLLININYIAEEIVRSLVGTLGLFAAVPITNLMACWAVDSPERIQKLCRVLGPLVEDNGHGHTHGNDHAH
ncbi:MAG: YibE/F family protein [Anaerolineae bacterium]|nr:YibE/F family protein [Anaerolineae bacterium]